MTDRLLIDLSADRRVSVSIWLSDELPGGVVAEPYELSWPLDDTALEELRWYLEDYLRAPFGVYEDRGPRVQERLASWGEEIFSAVFATGAARDAYQRLRVRSSGVQVVLRSSSAHLLALPWELMRDPWSRVPLALSGSGLDRSLPAAELGISFEAGGGRLRVLMVISRPAGAADVGFRMIARPLLERLQAVRGSVDLVVLRPPTLEALFSTITEAAAAGEPFQVVHFDGHGVLASRLSSPGYAPDMLHDSGPEGVLVFQTVDGGPDQVPVSRLAQGLAAGRVPVVVINACQSGAVGKELEAAVATRLLRGGAASVVAMAYSVYAVAAAEFMAAFYERLFAGDTVSMAVTSGRLRLFGHDLRPSPKGDLPLADWMVPVHYIRRDVRFPGLVTSRPGDLLSLEEALDRLSDPGRDASAGALTPVGVFTGRDALFYELESAARLQRVIVLHGPAGTGKTELAKAFGRWWQDTGGIDHPGWVFWHSFEPGLASFGLEGVIDEIGLSLFGPDFARLAGHERIWVVKGFLRDRRALLIWDNFESVRSISDPTAATPPLDEPGCDLLRDFLHALATDGRSVVLLTSRSEERWLDEAGDARMRRLEIGGLLPAEAAEYAGQLLAPYPAAAARRARRAFGQLMEWLDGHPLSMRLVLPHLDTTEPTVLLDGLRGTVPLPGWDDVILERGTSLSASLGYSYSSLAPEVRRLLVVLCLFHGIADADILAIVSTVDGIPGRFQGNSREIWTGVLDAAAEVGLLTKLGSGMYRIHPALPAYLAALWSSEGSSGYENQREASIRALLSAYADFGRWLRSQIASGDTGSAFAIIGLQLRTMGHLLGYALDTQHWREAQAIAEPLDSYWDARGRYADAGAWAERARLAVIDASGSAPALDSPAGALWLFFAGSQARRQVSSGHLDAAALSYHEILGMLEAQPSSPLRESRLAVAYHQLGRVAQDRGRLDEAADWYNKSLRIKEETGNRLGMASSYHQLGRVAQAQGRLDEAADWYARSLQFDEELGDRRGMVLTYQGLGMVAQERGRLDEAADWYTRSLAIAEDFGDRPGMARIYHQLGTVAQVRERLADAAEWYTRSLAIKEELGDQPGMASSYHQLGGVAYEQGRLDEAVGWYSRSLAIKEELGDRRGMALTYQGLGLVAQEQGRLDEAADRYTWSSSVYEEVGDYRGLTFAYIHLSSLAEARGNPDEALEWAVRSVTLLREYHHPPDVSGVSHLAHLTSKMGIEALEACWRKITGDSLPDEVRSYVQSEP